MPRKSKSEKKKKSKSHKYRSKISQKVIQKVVVKIGEERKAKKARRRYRRTQRASEKEQEQIINQLQSELVQQRVPPNVIYQTSAPFQAPQQQPSISEMVSSGRIGKLPEYISIENQESQPIYVPTKKEQLESFETPVSVKQPSVSVPEVFVNPLRNGMSFNEPINSKIYTLQTQPQEQVSGNYAFGLPDVSSDKPPIALVDNEVNLTTGPKPKPMSLGEFLINKPQAPPSEDFGVTLKQTVSEPIGAGYRTEPETEIEVVEKKKKERRSRSQIINERRIELQNLFELEGISSDKAFQFANKYEPKDLHEEIRKQKLVLKQRKIRIPKAPREGLEPETEGEGFVKKAYKGAKRAVSGFASDVGKEVLQETAKGKGIKAKTAEKLLQQQSETEGGSFLGKAVKSVGGAIVDVGKEVAVQGIKGLIFK